MKTYSVTFTREITQTHVIEVEAEDEDDAREQAEVEIGDVSDDDWTFDGTYGDPEIKTVETETEESEVELLDANAEEEGRQ